MAGPGASLQCRKNLLSQWALNPRTRPVPDPQGSDASPSTFGEARIQDRYRDLSTTRSWTVKVIASVEDPAVIKQILDHIEQHSESVQPKSHPVRALPQNTLPVPSQYHCQRLDAMIIRTSHELFRAKSQ